MEKYFSTTENGNSIFLNKDQEMNVQSKLVIFILKRDLGYSLEEIIDGCCKYSQKRQFPMKNSTLFETSIEMEAIPRLPQHIICNKRYF